MGASESVQVANDEDGDEEEAEEEEDDDDDDNSAGGVMNHQRRDLGEHESLLKKVLEQEPEMLPCHASASPLSPQLSAFGTPRLGPSIKVWDPYNVLAPPPPFPPPLNFSSRTFSSSDAMIDDDASVTQLFLICHGECHTNLRPDLIGGRCPDASLTPNGKRQARALAVFLKSQGVRFNAVYSSPLDRARATALSVCQEIKFSEEQILASDALLERSQGHWEGCHRSDVYTAEVLSLMDRFQPDFSAPSGESLRQVEFRMVQFLNGTVVGRMEKLRSDFSPPDYSLTNSTHDRDGPSLPPPHWDLLNKPRQGFRKKSGKSRLQIVTTTGDHEADDEMSPREPPSHQVAALQGVNVRSSSPCTASIGVFTHAIPIKCLVTGLLGCSAGMGNKICIDDSSVTVIQHSWKTGWQIKRLNDTAHLRLL